MPVPIDENPRSGQPSGFSCSLSSLGGTVAFLNCRDQESNERGKMGDEEASIGETPTDKYGPGIARHEHFLGTESASQPI